MTRIQFDHLRIGSLGSGSSVNSGINRLVRRQSTSLLNEGLGGISGDRNTVRLNWFGVRGRMPHDCTEDGLQTDGGEGENRKMENIPTPDDGPESESRETRT